MPRLLELKIGDLLAEESKIHGHLSRRIASLKKETARSIIERVEADLRLHRGLGPAAVLREELEAHRPLLEKWVSLVVDRAIARVSDPGKRNEQGGGQ